MDRMAVLLDLNDTQKAEVQKILNEQHEKLKAAHDQRAAPAPSRRAKSVRSFTKR